MSAAATDFPAHVELSLDELLLSRAHLRFVRHMMIDHIWTTRRAESKTSNPERLPLLGNFMLAVSNGGAGPNYGLKPLRDIVRGCAPGLPFDSESCSGPELQPGMIWLTDNGCATTTNLIVNGISTAGRTCDLYCEDDRIVLGNTFRSWYLEWLNGAIRMLVKEPILKKIKCKMKLDEVRAILGNELVTHDPRMTLLDNYFLSFLDVNGAIQFDFSDRVVSTRFAPHCLTPRWDKSSDEPESSPR